MTLILAALHSAQNTPNGKWFKDTHMTTSTAKIKNGTQNQTTSSPQPHPVHENHKQDSPQGAAQEESIPDREQAFQAPHMIPWGAKTFQTDLDWTTRLIK